MTPHKCPVCNGFGYLSIINQWPIPSLTAIYENKESCRACHGTCIVWEHDLHPVSAGRYQNIEENIMGVETKLTCDTADCGGTITLSGPYFKVKPEMKEKGWKNVKDGEGWKIKCADWVGK